MISLSRVKHLSGRVLLTAAGGVSFGLCLCRLLAETFPRPLAWLNNWPGTLLLTIIGAATLIFWQRRSDFSAGVLPLFLPLLYLFHPETDLIKGSTLALGGLVLFVLFLSETSRPWLTPLLLAAVTLGVYLSTLGRTVGAADTFEFQVVAQQMGIAHPTGYPLYLLLGKLFTWLPWGSIALRVNLLSAVCATAATLIIYFTLQMLSPRIHPNLALLGALVFAFSPTLWSQAVEAEVYALNNFWVAFVLWALLELTLPKRSVKQPVLVPLLGLALGLSLANHLTTLILFPVVGLTLLLARPRLPRKRWLWSGLLFAAGVSLYLYLPLRWPAVHDGTLMPWRTFVDWVIGGRFQGALQLRAWLDDPGRYSIVGRLVLDQWGWPGVVLGALGLLALLCKTWRLGLITLTIWLGYLFYGLDYYVPDISVFIIPAHLVMTVWIGYGVWILSEWLQHWDKQTWLQPAVITLFALLPLSLIFQHYPVVDRSAPNPLETWGREVLDSELDTGAVILADSEKIAPLYYLQQTEGLRPDLDIMVLPDEASYRTELDTRVAAGQTVYLARFLPRLEGVYHLRSAGQLVKVSKEPLLTAPSLDKELDLHFGSSVTLLGYNAESLKPAYPDPLQFTLFWTASESVNGIYQVGLRLVGDDYQWESVRRHPAGGAYPTSAWRPGEIIPDTHHIDLPLDLSPGSYQLQVALLAPFSDEGLLPAGQNEPWVTVGSVTVGIPRELPRPDQPLCIWLDDSVIIGLNAPAMVRPETEFPVTLFAEGDSRSNLRLGWESSSAVALDSSAPAAGATIQAPSSNGQHTLALWSDIPMYCGWLGAASHHCPLTAIEVQGAPLPAGATNFDDQIALMDTDIPQLALQPGGMLEVTFQWQALSPIQHDYTLFLHILDPADQFVGQIDSWPVQGTYPTSQWPVGQIIEDHYRLPIAADAAAGTYRLEIGWYLLGTMQRLNVLDANGHARDNRLLLDGLIIP